MLLAGALLAGPSFAAGEPTMHEVYQAAAAGHFGEAQGMMDKVLRDHPNSGKAHYVEAELLAKQSSYANAAAELATAERLAPGLPFAKPQAVQDLQRRIAAPRTATSTLARAYTAPAGLGSRIPLGLLLAGAAFIAALIYFVRTLTRRSGTMLAPAGGAAYGGAPLQPNGPGGVAAPAGSTAGGVGSGILGGLATGAALGAGMVAGEALMHRLTGGNQLQGGQGFIPGATDWDATPDDMGGSDFGMSDSSSWDDNSGGGDWN
jgi:uncharacterized protein